MNGPRSAVRPSPLDRPGGAPRQREPRTSRWAVALALVCLASCATDQSAARDDDDVRLARNADLQREGTKGTATADDDQKPAPRPADQPAPRPAEKPAQRPAETAPQEPAKASSGNTAAAAQLAALEAAKAAQGIGAAKARAEAECAGLEGRAVPWSEEATVGRVMAASLLAKGAYLDETEPAKLRQQAGAPALPKGEKNDVVAYVQALGASLAAGSLRPGIAWTFGVIDDAAPRASSAMGGYVFVTRGLVSALENEAQLAAMLAHEIAHVALKHPVAAYVKSRQTMCLTGLTGLYLQQSGAANVPGGADFVANSKFSKTMQQLASAQGLDFDKNPDVDTAFLRWYLARTFDLQQLVGPSPELEAQADAEAVQLLASAGYDSASLGAALARVDAAKNAQRIAALDKLRSESGFGAKGGKSPPYPKELKLPR